MDAITKALGSLTAAAYLYEPPNGEQRETWKALAGAGSEEAERLRAERDALKAEVGEAVRILLPFPGSTLAMQAEVRMNEREKLEIKYGALKTEVEDLRFALLSKSEQVDGLRVALEKAEAEVERLKRNETDNPIVKLNRILDGATAPQECGHPIECWDDDDEWCGWCYDRLQIEEETERADAAEAGWDALREGIQEALDTEDHAGGVCGHCKSRVGRAGRLYNMLRALLGKGGGGAGNG